MKKSILALGLITLFFTANAQNEPTKTKKKEMKEHACNSSCTSEKHHTVCGEKGHTCTVDCKKSEQKMAKHGEKGHVCKDACKKM